MSVCLLIPVCSFIYVDFNMKTKLTMAANLLQGLPSGFDLKYLALADRNIQVRFGLKVVWES